MASLTELLLAKKTPSAQTPQSPLLQPAQTGMAGSTAVTPVDASLMGQADQSMAEGLAQNQASDEDNRIAREAYEGELRRQRMLEGRPQDSDLAAQIQEQEEAAPAPEGGYRVISLYRFANSLGNWVNHENGYFVPKNQEEKDMLDHYAANFLVEPPADKPQE